MVAEVTKLRAALAERERQIDAVHRISQALYTKTKLDDLLRETLQVSLETVEANAGSLILHDAESDKLVFKYVIGDAASFLTGFTMETTRGIAGEVFHSGEARITDDVTKDDKHNRDVDQQSGFVTRNMVTVALKTAEGRPIGVMQALNKTDGLFTEQDLEVLSILGPGGLCHREPGYEEARLAEVVKLMGDIHHDIKNMMPPSAPARRR